LKAAVNIHDEIIKNRVIMNFKQEGSRTEQVLKSIEAMILFGKFAADAVIVDGYNFSQSTCEDLGKFKEFAKKLNLEVWFSASLKETGGPLYDTTGVPLILNPLCAAIDVLITLHAQGSHVELRVVKDHEYPAAGRLPIKLDPKTLLIA
jgi:hypothetical protein